MSRLVVFILLVGLLLLSTMYSNTQDYEVVEVAVFNEVPRHTSGSDLDWDAFGSFGLRIVGFTRFDLYGNFEVVYLDRLTGTEVYYKDIEYRYRMGGAYNRGCITPWAVYDPDTNGVFITYAKVADEYSDIGYCYIRYAPEVPRWLLFDSNGTLINGGTGVFRGFASVSPLIAVPDHTRSYTARALGVSELYLDVYDINYSSGAGYSSTRNLFSAFPLRKRNYMQGYYFMIYDNNGVPYYVASPFGVATHGYEPNIGLVFVFDENMELVNKVAISLQGARYGDYLLGIIPKKGATVEHFRFYLYYQPGLDYAKICNVFPEYNLMGVSRIDLTASQMRCYDLTGDELAIFLPSWEENKVIGVRLNLSYTTFRVTLHDLSGQIPTFDEIYRHNYAYEGRLIRPFLATRIGGYPAYLTFSLDDNPQTKIRVIINHPSFPTDVVFSDFNYSVSGRTFKLNITAYNYGLADSNAPILVYVNNTLVYEQNVFIPAYVRDLQPVVLTLEFNVPSELGADVNIYVELNDPRDFYGPIDSSISFSAQLEEVPIEEPAPQPSPVVTSPGVSQPEAPIVEQEEYNAQAVQPASPVPSFGSGLILVLIAGALLLILLTRGGRR